MVHLVDLEIEKKIHFFLENSNSKTLKPILDTLSQPIEQRDTN